MSSELIRWRKFKKLWAIALHKDIFTFHLFPNASLTWWSQCEASDFRVMQWLCLLKAANAEKHLDHTKWSSHKILSHPFKSVLILSRKFNTTIFECLFLPIMRHYKQKSVRYLSYFVTKPQTLNQSHLISLNCFSISTRKRMCLCLVEYILCQCTKGTWMKSNLSA